MPKLKSQPFILLQILLISPTVFSADDPPKLSSVRLDNLEYSNIPTNPDDFNAKILHVQSSSPLKLRFSGVHLRSVSSVLLTPNSSHCIEDLPPPSDSFLEKEPDSLLLLFSLPNLERDYYVCFLANFSSEFSHQGLEAYKRIRVSHEPRTYILPLGIQISIIALLFVLSGCFSGLNLGLMSLSTMELKVFQKAGTKREQHYARIILPVRSQGNYLLCSILFGNVMVNSAISILMDDLTGGIVALIVSTLGIVILSEIMPQALCSRYGLACGANTIWLTRLFMILTAPLSWPIGKLLDLAFGEDVGTVYNKRHLLELIRLTNSSDKGRDQDQEVAIVAGALEFGKKTVRDVLTHMPDVFMLPADSVLDSKTVQSVVQSGYTRVPVFEQDESGHAVIIGVLNVKDLALLDPDDKIPIRTVLKFYEHKVRFVLDDTPLGLMLDEFKKGQYHLAFVQRIVESNELDPTYELVGIVTLEDVIEEILQAEINDETDVVSDNRARIARNPFEHQRTAQLSSLVGEVDSAVISPQMAVAAYQYLSTSLPPFGPEYISPLVLQRLIKNNVVRASPLVNIGTPTMNARPLTKKARVKNGEFLYESGKSADFFVLVLNGQLEVRMGAEDFVFEAGPFFYFGKQILESMAELAPRLSVRNKEGNEEVGKRVTFLPDFTVRVTEEVVYLKVRGAQYLQAYRATLIEKLGLVMTKKSESKISTVERSVSDSQGERPVGFVKPSNLPRRSMQLILPLETEKEKTESVVSPELESNAQGMSRADSFVSMDFGRTSSEIALEQAEQKEMSRMVREKRLRLVNRKDSLSER